MYKIISTTKNKTNSMKKLLMFTPLLLFFFLMGTANAYLVNFTGSTPKELLTTVNAIDQIKGRYFNDSWFITYTFYDPLNDKGNLISRWSNDFSIREKDWNNLFGNPTSVYYIDWAINTNYLNVLNNNKIIYLTSSGSGATCKINNMTYQLKNTTLATDLGCAGTYSVSIADNMVYIKQIGGTVYYGDVLSTYQGSLSFGSNGTLTLPSSFTSFMGNNTLRFLYVPSINEYWLFYPDQNSIIQLSRYDNAFAYINTHQITGSGQLPATDYFSGLKIYPDYDAVYSEKYGYVVYLAIHEFMNNTVKILALDTVSTKQINNAVLVDSQIINMTVNDPLVNTTNNITALSLGYNPDTSHFNIFYAYRSSATGTSVSVLEENVLCQCSAWVNTSECIDNQYRKQTKTCVPSSCNNETIQYILDPICQYVPPPSMENATKFYVNDSLCIRYGNELGTTAKCDFNMEVPAQCQLNTVIVTINGHVEPQNANQCDKGKYNLTLCNPSFICNKYSKPCDEYNWTFEYPRYTYQPSNKALLQSYGFVSTDCGSMWCGFNRWDRFDFYSYMKIECQIGCYNHTICGSGDYFGYSCFERSDCVPGECSFCSSGCNEATGLCIISGQEGGGTGGISSPTGNPIQWIFGETKAQFGFGGGWFLTLISIAITGGSMIYTGIISKNWIIALVIAMGMALFFLTIQWLPAWIGLLWVLSIALILTNMFREKFTGK